METDTRAFFAFKPDDHAVQQLLDRIRYLIDSGWGKFGKFADAESLHVTLRYLGSAPAEALEKIREGARAIAAETPAFQYQIGSAKLFPRVARARVIAAMVEAPSVLRELNRKLEAIAVGAGLKPESQAFRPHLTLCRLRNSEARPNLPRYGAPIPQRAARLILFTSTLTSTGASYQVLDEFPLSESLPAAETANGLPNAPS